MSLPVVVTSGDGREKEEVAILEWLKGSPRVALLKYLDEMLPKQNLQFEFLESRFIAWLIENGYARRAETVGLHLGAWGQLYISE